MIESAVNQAEFNNSIAKQYREAKRFGKFR